MPFAQLSEISPAQIGIFAATLAAFLSVYMKIRKFEDRVSGKPELTEISPQPLTVRPATEFATKGELTRVEKDLRDDLTKQAGARKEIHRDIESLRVAIGVLEERSQNTQGQLVNLDTKMDRVLERLPRKQQ